MSFSALRHVPIFTSVGVLLAHHVPCAILFMMMAILGWVLVLTTFASTLVFADELAISRRNVVYFDAGPRDSTRDASVIELNAETVYSPELGYGWLELPQAEFVRKELLRSRDKSTRDGVQGQRLRFRADIDPGKWRVTLWVEAGNEDASTQQLVLQGKEQDLGWQAFLPQAEPRSGIQRIYRVFQTEVLVGKDGLTCELIGVQDEVRLLSLSLIRYVGPTSSDHDRLLKQINLVGRYNSQDSIKNLAHEIETYLRENEQDAFWAYWHEQLKLLSLAERYFLMRGWDWADDKTGLTIFERLHQAVMLFDGVLGSENAVTGPLAARALYMRGRLLYWLGLERHGPHEIAGGKRDLDRLYSLHPDDRLLAMYTGEKVDIADACDCLVHDEAAPTWSVAQREALCRLRDIAHWWINEQQAENGELGGKPDDDVEIMRWWIPLVLVGDKVAQQGWQRLADGIWESPHIHQGYVRVIRDVEHGSEFIADTAPIIALFHDNEKYVDRLAYSANHFDNLWTAKTVHGNRFFRSAWFSSTDLKTEEPLGRDLPYNSRAVKALRYYVWRHPDPKVVQSLYEWSLAWVDVALRTDKGKPKGLIPASVRFSDESFNGDGSSWYRANMFWPYFEWEHSGGSMILDHLLFTYTLTQDEKLLEPLFLALELIRSAEPSLESSLGKSFPEGSSTWAAKILVESELFWSVVEQWRFFSKDSRWDDLIKRYGSQYGRYRLSADESHLAVGLERVLADVRFNRPLKTNEAIHTDRVDIDGVEHLKAMLTGDGSKESLCPYFAVSWEETDEDFTALVSSTGSNRLRVQLYSHASDDRLIVMRPWQLNPGHYQLRLEFQGGDVSEQAVTIKKRGERLPINLASRRLQVVTIETSE